MLSTRQEEGGNEYFLGAMLFIESAGSSTSSRRWPRSRTPERYLEVVDGFQRLSTLTILMCALRDLDAEANQPANPQILTAIQAAAGKPGPRFELREGRTSFSRVCPRTRARYANPATRAWSLRKRARLRSSRSHRSPCSRCSNRIERRRLADFLLRRCCVVLVTTDGIDRAYRMFTVLNTTGKDLARNDILKALLLGTVHPSAAGRCLEIWKQAEALLGDRFESLFTHIRARFGRPGDKIIDGIMDIAKARGPQAFIEDVLQPAARIVNDIDNARHSGSPHSPAISQYMRYLGWHSFSDWKPVVLAWWLRHGEDAAALEKFLAKLDRLAFGVRILGIGGSKRAHRFGVVTAAIEAGRDVMGGTARCSSPAPSCGPFSTTSATCTHATPRRRSICSCASTICGLARLCPPAT